MAGGLFGVPFTINVKCIIFSIIIMALFLYKPNIKSQFLLYCVLALLFILSYVALAWYDFAFSCSTLPLEKGKYSFLQFLKPPAHKPKKQTEQTEQKSSKTNKDKNLLRYLIYFSHILIIVPLLVYIAYYKNKIDPSVYPLLGALAFLTLTYHGYSVINMMFNV